MGEREVAFYHAMAAGKVPAIVRCYDAVYDVPSRRSHVLLDDLSATHFQRPSPIPPAPVELEGLVEVLAGLHAQWWASSRLDTELGALWDQDARHAQRQRLDATLPAFLDVFGAALLPAQRAAYEHILASSLWQRRDERLRQRRAVTLLHGDVHPGNILLPRDPARHRAVLIDWHLWEVGPGTDDLAFFIAHKWAPMRRAALEQPLVRRYHEHLVAQGIADYGWDDCWRDYRQSVALTTLAPIGQFRRQADAGSHVGRLGEHPGGLSRTWGAKRCSEESTSSVTLIASCRPCAARREWCC